MSVSPASVALGRPARALWTLRDDGIFLNQGSYGAVPRVVQQAHARLREEMDRHPDAFMQRVRPLEGAAVREVAAKIGDFTGTTADHIALMENTTSAIQAVLNSLPFQPGDQILATDHQYNAVRLAVEARCRQTGAEPVVVRIPLPTSHESIVGQVLAAAGPRVRLALVDHITSSTALVFPVAQIAAELRRRGIPLFVDGAHAIGHVPLDLPAIGADWYVSNLHKWLYAPRGTAMLYASGAAMSLTRPLVTSHYVELGFPRAFDYVGTRDYSVWLAAPAALDFHRELGAERLRAHQAMLVAHGSRALEDVGAQAIAPPALSPAMRAFRLPQSRPALPADAAEVMAGLWNAARIQVRCASMHGTLLLRICAQAYVDADELTQLAQVLDRIGWPARR